MRLPWLVGSWWLLACLAPLGCAALPLLPLAAPTDRTEISPPGEDGTQYVMVEGGRLTSAKLLERRWKSTVRQTCEGEAMELSQSSYARRQGGIVRSRIHEGYVRCVLPSEAEPGASPRAPTAAEATASKPTRPDRPRRRRRVEPTAVGRR
ncbi:MAG: hypothetical protein AAGF11_23335 [Myxococcota bacterium]